MNIVAGHLTNSSQAHKHNYYEIIFYRKCFGTFYISKGSIAISPGVFIIVPPDVVHSSKYEGKADTFYINGDFKHIFSFSSPVVVNDNGEKVGEFLIDLIYKNRFSNPEYLTSLSSALAHFLLQNVRTDKNISAPLHDIITKISDNFYDSKIDVREILQKSGYAEDYIRSQFKAFTGKTPVEFLTELRINHACYLIGIYKNTLTLTEIAEKCGYTDYVYFSRRFKQIMGVSPKSYMKI